MASLNLSIVHISYTQIILDQLTYKPAVCRGTISMISTVSRWRPVVLGTLLQSMKCVFSLTGVCIQYTTFKVYNGAVCYIGKE